MRLGETLAGRDYRIGLGGIALHHPELELLDLTTTYGNVDVETATHNALLHPELFTTAGGHLSVTTSGNVEGQTIFAPEGRGFIETCWSQTPLMEACLGADGDAISDWIADPLA